MEFRNYSHTSTKLEKSKDIRTNKFCRNITKKIKEQKGLLYIKSIKTFFRKIIVSLPTLCLQTFSGGGGNLHPINTPLVLEIKFFIKNIRNLE